jgi:hypothetical protein
MRCIVLPRKGRSYAVTPALTICHSPHNFANEFGTGGSVPRRLKNKELRTREHLTEKEVEDLIKVRR